MLVLRGCSFWESLWEVGRIAPVDGCVVGGLVRRKDVGGRYEVV